MQETNARKLEQLQQEVRLIQIILGFCLQEPNRVQLARTERERDITNAELLNEKSVRDRERVALEDKVTIP
jgi:hypothetical protein